MLLFVCLFFVFLRGGGGVALASVHVIISGGGARRLLLDQKDILSLGVHDACLFKVSVEAYRLGILLLGQ